jgi:hypothetical protein
LNIKKLLQYSYSKKTGSGRFALRPSNFLSRASGPGFSPDGAIPWRLSLPLAGGLNSSKAEPTDLQDHLNAPYKPIRYYLMLFYPIYEYYTTDFDVF